jgi:hypothetical protein
MIIAAKLFKFYVKMHATSTCRADFYRQRSVGWNNNSFSKHMMQVLWGNVYFRYKMWFWECGAI